MPQMPPDLLQMAKRATKNHTYSAAMAAANAMKPTEYIPTDCMYVFKGSFPSLELAANAANCKGGSHAKRGDYKLPTTTNSWEFTSIGRQYSFGGQSSTLN